jgi:hypothetical protein
MKAGVTGKLLGGKEAARSGGSPSGSWKVTVGQEGFVAMAMWCGVGRLGVVVCLAIAVVLDVLPVSRGAP